MSRTQQRLTRILSMLPWVIAHPGATVDDVCNRFAYTKQELLRDLDLVFVCGLPGYGPGDLMEAYVAGDEVVVDMADYFSKPLRLSPAEALGLLAAGMALLSTDQGTDALERAVEKLGAALLPGAEEALVVDLAGEPVLVDRLRQAASDRDLVRIKYTSIGKGETTERYVEPWSVFSALGNWYLSAYCRTAGDERVFRVDRIQAVTETGEHFDPPQQPPRTEVRYLPGDDDVRAVIQLSRRAGWVIEYYPVDVLATEKDSTTVRFSARDVGVIARLLLRLGPDARLIEGDGVGKAVADLRARILQRYGISA